MSDTDQADSVCSGISKFLNKIHIDGIYTSFQVNLPNNKFKKSVTRRAKFPTMFVKVM
jgi:hypothetical protein